MPRLTVEELAESPELRYTKLNLAVILRGEAHDLASVLRVIHDNERIHSVYQRSSPERLFVTVVEPNHGERGNRFSERY